MHNKWKWCRAGFVLLLAVCGCSNRGVETAPSLWVTSPVQSSTCSAGSICTIRWSTAGTVDNTVDIDLVSSSSAVLAIASSATNSGSFDWTIPTAIVPDSGYYICVTCKGRNAIHGLSGIFTIVNETDAFEPDSSKSHATPIGTDGVSQMHRISGNDADWFTFEAAKATAYCFGTHGMPLQIVLYRSDATTRCLSGNIGGIDPNMAVLWTCDSTETCYFRITAPGVSSNGEYSVNVRSGAAILAIQTPASGVKSFSTGLPLHIGWVLSANSGTYVTLTAWRDDTLACVIASQAANTGLYDWTIPPSLAGSTRYRIEMMSGQDTSIRDVSDQFTVVHVPTAFTIINPLPSAKWNSDSTYSIQWTYTGNPGTAVSLALFDSVGPVYSICWSNVLCDAGSYVWSIPWSTATKKYRIRIASISDTTISAFSGFFTITHVPVTFNLISPVATTLWTAGTACPVYWSCSGPVGTSARIDLYNDATFLQALSSTVTSSTGSYLWLIPTQFPAGTRYRIKITSTSNSSVYAFSEYFAVAAAPTMLTITKPTAASSWITWYAAQIQWTSTGAPLQTVKLDLYDSTAFVSRIVAGCPAAGNSFTWMIPSDLHTDSAYRIRIADSSSDTIFALSDYFKITNVLPSLSVTSPTSASAWTAGSNHFISWTSTSNVPGSFVSLWLFDSLQQATVITALCGKDDGNFSWSIPPAQPAGMYRAMVASTSDTTIYGLSPVFSIVGVAAPAKRIATTLH